MLKKRLSLILVITMVLSMFVPTAFAMDQTSLYQDSDRAFDVQDVTIESTEYENPFGAVQANEEKEEMLKFSMLSMSNSYLPEVDKTTGSSIYGHLYHISNDIGARASGSEKEIEAKDYIVDVLKNQIGYKTTVQPFAYTRESIDYNSNNIIAVKPGKSEKQIIVGAHYDSVTAVQGASDNASGVAVMLGVAEILKDINTDYTIKFIAFGAEEAGLRGSNYYASQMSETEIANTISMINLDTILVGDKMYSYGSLGEKSWVNDQALALAKALDLDVDTQYGLNPDYPAGTTGDWSDHVAFKNLGLPWLYFESTNWEDTEGLDGSVETVEQGKIMHTEKDNLDFLHEKFPGRIEDRLYTYTTLLSNLLVEINPPVENYLGITTSTNLLSMSKAKEVEVSVTMGYIPDLENLEWTFGCIPFEEWKSFISSGGGSYSGEPFIKFAIEPYIDGNTVRAVIKCELPYGTSNLQGRPNPRTRFPELLGEYNLAVNDITTNTTVKTAMKLNAYDSYHTYDEILPAVERIIDIAKADRYLEYDPMGKSAEGRDIPFVMFARDKSDLDNYLNETLPMMLENPAIFIDNIKSETVKNYKPAIWFNNIHSDESNGVDAQLDMLEILATEDEITFDTVNDNDEIITVTLNVQDLLDNYILLFNLNNNPDGRFYNTRTTLAGFDPNRDVTYQTQVETANVFQGLAKWSPMIMNDFHGFVKQFLIEPCTPPHDPNFEFDLLMDGMIDHANAMGRAGISNTDYNSYIIPMFDYGDGWDDGAPMYAAVLGMMHGALGHTIEIPELNQESNNAFVYAGFGSLLYALENKEKLFINQLEIYRRGVEGIDSREVDTWLVNAKGESIGRARGENDNFFPQYYVIPTDNGLQKNPLAAYEMAEYLINNGIKVERTTAQVTVGDVNYPLGSYIVPMHQAKRGLANTLLYDGTDVSDWGAMYAEVTMSFPHLRGFDKYEIRVDNAFEGKTEEVTHVTIPATNISCDAEQIIIKNTNNDVIKAVNELLNKDKLVQMTYSAGENYSKGDFVVAKKDLETIKDKYFLEIQPYRGYATLKVMKQPKVAALGSELVYVLKGLGFNLVNSYDEADVIVDASSYSLSSTIKSSIQSGKSYVGVGGNPVNAFATSDLLLGIKVGRTGSSYEGVLRAVIDTDSVITGGYSKNDFLYNKSGSWIETVPSTSKVIATLSNEDDFYVAGWWPGHDAAKGKPYIIQDQVGNAKITLFANHITNRAHPSHQFRMLANAIYDSTIVIKTGGSSNGGNSNGSSGGSEIAIPETIAEETIKFPTDIAGHWAEENIKELIKLGAIAGYTDGTFKPNTNITRAEFATILVKAFDLKAKSEMVFSDTVNHWAKDFISIASSNGIILGYGDNLFGPNDLITREQMAVMISKTMNFELEELELSFIDKDQIADWAKVYVGLAVKAKVISGYPDNTYKPKANATRAEVVMVIINGLTILSN